MTRADAGARTELVIVDSLLWQPELIDLARSSGVVERFADDDYRDILKAELASPTFANVGQVPDAVRAEKRRLVLAALDELRAAGGTTADHLRRVIARHEEGPARG